MLPTKTSAPTLHHHCSLVRLIVGPQLHPHNVLQLVLGPPRLPQAVGQHHGCPTHAEQRVWDLHAAVSTVVPAGQAAGQVSWMKIAQISVSQVMAGVSTLVARPMQYRVLRIYLL